MLKVIIETKNEKPREITLPAESDRISVGRADTNSVQIPEPRSSREHCLFEKTDRGWKLIDLESANGTRVNGDMVNSRLLQEGDEVQIGETVLRLVEEKARSKAPAKAHSPLPSRSPAPAHKTRVLEKPRHRDSSRSLPAQPAKKRPPWELFYIAGGILVLLVVGTTLFNKLSKDSAVSEGLEKATALLSRAQEASELGVRLERYEEAREKLHRLADRFPETSQAETARRLLRETEEDFEKGRKWMGRWRAITADTARLSGTKDIAALKGTQARIQSFVQNCPYPEIALLAQDEAAKIEKDLQAAVERLFTDRKAEIEVDLGMEEYDQALRKWKLFLEEYASYPAVTAKAREQIESVKKKAESNFQVLLAKGESLIDQKRYREATVLFRNAAKKYAGTPAAEAAFLKLRVIRLLMKGNTNRHSAEAEVEARKELYKNASMANVEARNRRYAKAVEIYESILAKANSEEVREEFAARVQDLRSLDGLFRTFRKRANEGQLKRKPWKLGSDMEVFVASADEEWVRFELGGGNKGKTQKRWNSFRDEDLVRLVQLMDMGPEERYALGVFCFLNNLGDRGEEFLVDAFNENPALIDRINLVVARNRGESVPRQGYVPYNGRWYTVEARDRAMEDRRISDLADVVAEGSLDKAGRAMEKLLRIPRGKPRLLDALRRKREALKKRIAGSLQFNNATLVALKKELDRRRAYALDFIEDPERYPDKKKTPPNIYRLAQKEVDERVKAVEEIWKNPYTAAVKLNAASEAINKDLQTVNGWLARADKSFDKEKEDKVDMNYIAKLANAKLSIKTFSLDTKEQKVISYNIEVMKWNETNKEASQVERRQVAILNEYRWMLGRRCVKIESMLVRAARGHSAYMDATGKWGHVIPGHPDGERPSDRCKKAGYTGAATSENISKGHTDAMGTHVAWYHSSGHHRNMINRNWLVMGAGLKGIHWTQNFGNKDTTISEPNSPSPPGHAGTAWRGGMAKKKSE